MAASMPLRSLSRPRDVHASYSNESLVSILGKAPLGGPTQGDRIVIVKRVSLPNFDVPPGMRSRNLVPPICRYFDFAWKLTRWGADRAGAARRFRQTAPDLTAAS